MKVWNYVFISITMILFLQLAGYPTAFSGLFGFMNIEFNPDNSINSTSISFSNFQTYLFGEDTGDSSSGWLATLIGAGIAAGLFATGRSDIAIKAGFATAIFVSFVPTLYFSVTYALSHGVAAWAVGILGVIFIPFSAMFLFALVEYVAGGTD